MVDSEAWMLKQVQHDVDADTRYDALDFPALARREGAKAGGVDAFSR